MALNVVKLFREPATEAGFSPVYYAQKVDYNERYGIYQQNARRWRLTAFGCIAIALLAVSGLVYDDSLSKFVPYVVERDNLGDAVAIAPAQKTSPAEPRVVQAEINRWLHDVRNVSTDAQTERENILRAYAHTDKSGPAKAELDDWFTTSPNPPWKRAETEIVTTTVLSTLPKDPHNWRSWIVKWREETRTRTGELVRQPQTKEMSVEVVWQQPKTDAEFKANPSGIFVENFDWLN